MCANRVNKTAGGPPVAANQLAADVGGVAVFSEPLDGAGVAAVCAQAAGFGGA